MNNTEPNRDEFNNQDGVNVGMPNDNMQNAVQNDYYSNENYYSNSNYTDNYSDTSYEEKEKKNNIWWKILLAILVLLIIIILLLKFCGGGTSKDTKYAQLQTKICEAAKTYAGNNPGLISKDDLGKSVSIKLQTLSNSNLIESRIENPYYSSSLFKKNNEEKYYSMESVVRLTVNAAGEFNCEMVDNSGDITAPELRLNGDAEISLAIGTEFEDPGYTATDDYDGDVTDKVVRSGNVDISTPGEYEITYSVADSAGNTTSKTRKIIIEEYADIEITLGSILDTVTPMISLKGSNPYCMVKGTKYIEPGAIATDNVDGDITNRIAVTNKVTGNLMGAFRVVYKVEDSSGNQAIAYRAVIVTTECPDVKEETKLANNAPKITLIGKTAVTIAIGENYIDLGATAYDKEDGDLTNNVVIDTSAVNENQAGIYKVNYKVTDSAGAKATAVRTVTVKKAISSNTKSPSVTFKETKSNITKYVGEGSNALIKAPKALNENGVEVVVNTIIKNATTNKEVSSIDWNNIGKYYVSYTAIHGNGTLKQSTKPITVTIKSKGITIGGANSITVTKRAENCAITEADLVGITYEPITPTPRVSLSNATGNACNVGTYTITVTASNDDGAIASKAITVNVVDGSKPIDISAPSKVIITGNSANPNDPYNKGALWVGGTVEGVILTFTSTPVDNTVISKYDLSFDCNTVSKEVSKVSATMGTATLTEEGKNKVCIRAVTTAGIAGPWSDPVNVFIDKTGPTIEFTHTWADDSGDWHNDASLTLSYSGSDTASGIDHFEYTYDDVKGKEGNAVVDPKTVEEATGKLTVSENTESSRPKLFVYVRAVDKVGNRGEWTLNPAYANIDTVAPEAPAITIADNNTTAVKLNAVLTDNKSIRPSGFGSLAYKVGEETENTVSATSDATDVLKGTGQIVLTNSTEVKKENVKVLVWAVDKAGNRSKNSTDATVTILPSNKKATGITLKNGTTEIGDKASCSTSNVYVGDTIQLTATVIPSDSDEKAFTWASSSGKVATIDKTGKISATESGTATITVKVGSISKTCTLTVKTKTTSYVPYVPKCNVENCSECSKDNYCSKCISDKYTLENGKCVEKKEESEGVTCYCEHHKTGVIETKIIPKGNDCVASVCGPVNLYKVHSTTPCNQPNCTSCSSRNANVCISCNKGYKSSGDACVKESLTKCCKVLAATEGTGSVTGTCTCYSQNKGISYPGACKGEHQCICQNGDPTTQNSCKWVSNYTCTSGILIDKECHLQKTVSGTDCGDWNKCES